MTPLTKAAKECDITTVQTIIGQGGNVNEGNSGKYAAKPLHWVAYYCKEEDALKLVKVLIDNGADVNARDSSGSTPLLLAANNNYTNLSLFLIEKGADVNAGDNYGNRPILSVASRGNAEMAKTLLNKGADIHASNAEGMTPLMYAAMYGDARTAQYLMEKGADVLAYDRYGKTAFYYAVEYKKYEVAKLLKDAEDNIAPVKRNNTDYSKLKSIIKKVRNCMTPDREYMIYVSRKGAPNAWVNISGNITFTQAAIEQWDDDTLTLVAAHEIAHDTLGHVVKKMGVSYATTTVMTIAGYIVPGLGLLNYVINPAITNNYSKVQELDADKVASEACERCFGMTNEKQLDIMLGLKEKSKGDGGGFWSTHPAWDDRIKNVRKK